MRLTCYYGYPGRGRKRQVWDLMREFYDMSNLPWCIIEDFKDLLSQDDKQGIHPYPNCLCMRFRNAFGDCDLTDIRLKGHQFTWIKSRGTSHVVERILGRVVENTD